MVTGAKEIEVDSGAKNKELVVTDFSVHIENTGVHSGDASIMHPAQVGSKPGADGWSHCYCMESRQDVKDFRPIQYSDSVQGRPLF